MFMSVMRGEDKATNGTVEKNHVHRYTTLNNYNQSNLAVNSHWALYVRFPPICKALGARRSHGLCKSLVNCKLNMLIHLHSSLVTLLVRLNNQ